MCALEILDNSKPISTLFNTPTAGDPVRIFAKCRHYEKLEGWGSLMICFSF